jgi:hypothetical protein
MVSMSTIPGKYIGRRAGDPVCFPPSYCNRRDRLDLAIATFVSLKVGRMKYWHIASNESIDAREYI